MILKELITLPQVGRLADTNLAAGTLIAGEFRKTV
jgi:hypothetical protein